MEGYLSGQIDVRIATVHFCGYAVTVFNTRGGEI